MNGDRTRRLSLLVGAVLLVTAAAACGTAGKSVTRPVAHKSVSLTLLGGRKQRATACSATHHYQVYPLGTRLSMVGRVTPAPALPDGQWTVKIKFKQCVGGHFITVSEIHVPGKNGRFRYTAPQEIPGFFFARAYYYGSTPSIVSADEHFQVTR